MGILTDDCDMNDASMYMMHGGNGDYYIVCQQTKDKYMGDKFKKVGVRFAMSGGCISKYPKVAKAIWELYRAMEEAGLNNPDDKL